MPLGSGELAVRPELNVYRSTLDFLGNIIAGGFTVKSQTTDSVYHYVLYFGGDGTLEVMVLDDNLVAVQQFVTDIKTVPRVVSHCVLGDELVITSPDFPMMWSLVGGPLSFAQPVDSVNPGTTILPVLPRGISVSWAGRVVLSDGQGLYFSDALYPLTYVGANVVDPPGGVVYSLHVNAGGALIVVTSDGVWALPEDAAAVDQIVVGVFSKLTDYQCNGYDKTCSVNGRVYGLTKRGYKLVDEPGFEEEICDEQVATLTNSVNRITYDDYRLKRIIPGSLGPIVACDDKCLMVFIADKFKSWMLGGTFSKRLIARLYNNDGEEIYLFSDNIYVLGGTNLSGAYSSVKSSVHGRVKLSPVLSQVIRKVTFCSNSHKDFSMSIRGDVKTQTPKSFAGSVLGSFVWGSGKYLEPVLQSRSFNWEIRGDDLVFELMVIGYPYLIPDTLSIDFAGPGERRDTN
jgi:hypothetical protein